MKSATDFGDFYRFFSQRLLILIRGLMMLAVGILLIFGCILKPEVQIMISDSSWLPLIGIIVFLVGVAELFDTFVFRATKEFFMNLQLGLLDTVTGLFLLSGYDTDPVKLNLLVAAYLINKGLFRTISATAVKFPNFFSTLIGGVISVIMGLLLWSGWPFAEPWFISLCISIEIALRGWALTMFGFWLTRLPKQAA
ncbi:MAG: HdeD family acid-resistance protein [Gammaproteobacteria bacterium]